ncbi:hypothetical protein DFH94DRAFT_830903 [Russula ochroleuca]|uniref:Uncharacterized protein n=1 Tax=Russula ochroleuca TaxID=152965 RepID=A0A9P5T9B4_9AGAM|nr:hypothetical protein DFH94DRAFT_830903 [Russula ochroleuca]
MPPKAPSTRAKRNVIKRSSTQKQRVNGQKRVAETAVSESEDTDDAASDADQEKDYEDDVKSLHSDALDDDSDLETKKLAGKRKRASHVKTPRAKGSSPRKRRKNAVNYEDEEGEDYDLKEGQQVVGRVVQAPTTGRVPPGQISQNSLDFLLQLANPECNDREWFRLHEPVFRLAETEFKSFIEKLTDLFTEVDPQIPPLPPKDLIYRIYRDVRFSNDKTPYKTNFSASFSRSGRKGIFAGFKPGGGSLLAAGSWCPGKNELATIRSHIQHNPSRLRRIINAPLFVKNFGPPKPLSKKGRQNIFGREDELKTAPKGINKDHKDIDLLKCRSFVVLHQFTDEEVLDPNFGQLIMEVVKAAKPLVYCMNDYMTVGNDEGDEDEDPDADEEESGDEDQEGDEEDSG